MFNYLNIFRKFSLSISTDKRRCLFACFLLVTAVITSQAWTQDRNPPYPRFGVFTFSGQTEASVDIFKYFDVIACPPNPEMAQKFKQAKPERAVIASTGILYGDRIENIPDEWFYYKADGNRIPLFGKYYLMNITTLCPAMDMGDGKGPKQFVDHALDFLPQDIDFSVYEGVFFDWWWSGPGYDAKHYGDLDRNGVIDKEEWGLDSVITVWTDCLLYFHEQLLQIPGCDYVLLDIGTTWQPIYPLVNGFNWEDWPIFNGPWRYWRGRYNDEKTAIMREPRFMIMGAAHRHFYLQFPTDPYKNNYRAVRFAFTSNLFTSAYFFVDEGNADYGPGGPGHHGNLHFYDEFEAKGMLGYPVSEMTQIPSKSLASTPMAEGVWVRYFDHGVSVVNATGLDQTVSLSELAAYDPIGGSRYYKFRGGQDPAFNNGQEITDADPLVLWGDIAMANWTDPEVFGDGAMLFRRPTTLVTPIIVDNNVNNQTSPGSEPVAYSGDWVLDYNGEKCYCVYDNRDYGPFQRASFAWSAAGNGENTARYTPTVGLPGNYEVFEWHGYMGSAPGADLCSNVPVKVVCNGGQETTLTIDQTQNFGQWNSLGTFLFKKGTNGYVELSNDVSGTVLSDAIKFVFISADESLDLEAPSPPQGVEVY